MNRSLWPLLIGYLVSAGGCAPANDGPAECELGESVPCACRTDSQVQVGVALCGDGGVAGMCVCEGGEGEGEGEGEPAFERIIVPGACANEGSLSSIELSMLLLEGDAALRPDTPTGPEGQPAGALLDAAGITFSTAPADAALSLPEPGVAFEPGGEPHGTGLRTTHAVDLQRGEGPERDRRLWLFRE